MPRYYWVLFLLLFIVPVTVANAASPQEARQFVDDMGKKVIATVNTPGDESSKQPHLQQLFTQNVDIDWMGRFVLGRAWMQASAEERNQYLQVYREYLLARYTTNFKDYAGSHYTITGAKAESDGQFTVAMTVQSPNAQTQETQAGYRVRTGDDGQFKIVDIIIEGVSLINTQRSEFAASIQQGGLAALITQLQAKMKARAQ